MVCPYCAGAGEVIYIPGVGRAICPECQGSGIVSCCDTAGANEYVSAAEARRAKRQKALADLRKMDADLI